MRDDIWAPNVLPRRRACAMASAALFYAVGGLPVTAGAQTPLSPTGSVPGDSRMPAVNYPGMPSRGDQASTRRERGGHYVFRTEVNGVALPMMFDTGASQVVLRAEDAARVGVDVSTLRYTAVANTANGRAEVAPTVIGTLIIGSITRRNVTALVTRPGALNVNLLGQSFLSRLAGYRLEGEQLILQGGG